MKYVPLITLFFTIYILATPPLQAQIVRGSVKNKQGESIPYATLQLIKQNGPNDSTLIQGILTSESGNFEIKNIDTGDYKIKVSQLQYYTFTSGIFHMSSTDTTITIQLKDNTTILSEVTIQGTKSIIEYDNDRTIINVEKSILGSGSMAMDLIKLIPGATVDENGISLGGKDKVMVMINGSPTYMSSQQLTSYLSNLSSNQITRIEVTKNPSARYDAAGNAGMIDIRLKENTVLGYSGSLSTSGGMGRYPKQNIGLSIGYKVNKFTILGNYDYSYSKDYYDFKLIRNQAFDSNRLIINQNTYYIQPLTSHNVKFSIEKDISKNTHISLLSNNQFSYEGFNGSSSTSILPRDLSINNVLTNDNRDQNTSNSSLIFGLSQKLNQKVHFNYDLSFASIDETNIQAFESELLIADKYSLNGVKNFSSEAPNKIRIFASRADLTVQNRFGKWETGVKASSVDGDSEFRFLSYDNKPNNNSSLNRSFGYKEHVSAAYINHSRTIQKVNINAGLRFENTSYKGQEYILDSSFSRTYQQLFPAVSIRYELPNTNSLSVNYNRRIDRPDYQTLYPYTYFQDPLSYVRGNVLLNPQLSNNLAVVYSLLKANMTVTVAYNKTDQVMATLFKVDPANQRVQAMIENLTAYNQLSLEVSSTTKFSRSWSGQSSVNVFNNNYSGTPTDLHIYNNLISYIINSNQIIKINNRLVTEISFLYQSKANRGAFTQIPTWMLSTGIQYTFDKQKKILGKLNIQDIFRSYYYFRTYEYDSVNFDYRRRFDNRLIRASLIYVFSKGTSMNKAIRKESSIDEAQKRAGGSR